MNDIKCKKVHFKLRVKDVIIISIYFNLMCFQMLLLKTCDQVLKEIHVYNPWLSCAG